MLRLENECIALMPDAVLHQIHCDCDFRVEMSEAVYKLLKNGNIEMKCPVCKKVIK